jgi:hypothetical protein
VKSKYTAPPDVLTGVLITARVVDSDLKSYSNVGAGWRIALGIELLRVYDDGLIAIIPYMLGLLHLKGTFLRGICSTPVLEF